MRELRAPREAEHVDLVRRCSRQPGRFFDHRNDRISYSLIGSLRHGKAYGDPVTGQAGKK